MSVSSESEWCQRHSPILYNISARCKVPAPLPIPGPRHSPPTSRLPMPRASERIPKRDAAAPERSAVAELPLNAVADDDPSATVSGKTKIRSMPYPVKLTLFICYILPPLFFYACDGIAEGACSSIINGGGAERSSACASLLLAGFFSCSYYLEPFLQLGASGLVRFAWGGWHAAMVANCHGRLFASAAPRFLMTLAILWVTVLVAGMFFIKTPFHRVLAVLLAAGNILAVLFLNAPATEEDHTPAFAAFMAFFWTGNSLLYM